MSEQYHTSKWALGIYTELGLLLLALIQTVALALYIFLLRPLAKVLGVAGVIVLALVASFLSVNRAPGDIECPNCGARLRLCECDDSSWLNPH